MECSIQGEADWKPLIQRLQDCGAEHVYFVGSPYPNFQNVLSAANQLGYEPVWSVPGNFYGDDFREWNRDGLADKTYMGVYAIPFEEASASPATQQYLDILAEYGGDPSQLGEGAASAFLLWATAAKSCGSDLTRECVGAELDAVTEWDGGGAMGKSNPAARIPTVCAVLLKLDGATFVRVAPEEPGTFECEPSYAAKVTGPLVDAANLDRNRISQIG